MGAAFVVTMMQNFPFAYLNKHIQHCPSQDDNSKYANGKFCIIVTTNAAREQINKSKLEKLLPNKKTYYSNAKDKSTNNPNAPEVITSNHPKSKYKNNGMVFIY